MKKRVVIFCLILLSFTCKATHIVGGEITYDYLGNDKYRIVLKVYRDCSSLYPTADLDGTPNNPNPALLSVLNSSNETVLIHTFGPPIVTKVPPAFSNPCIQTPTFVCIQEGVYIDTLELPPLAGGYVLIYQKCCRNASILNLVNSGQEGSTYYTHIPGPEDAPVNSSPRFKKFPPIYICKDVNFVFDHSATDPDGDQLVYSLCPPFTGADPCCPGIAVLPPNFPSSVCISPPASCPTVAAPPPYASVLFSSPYNGSYPIASNPAFSINPVTGQLSGTPTLIAQYVVGVCIQEFRGSKLLNTHFRDFQFTVVNCTVSVLGAIANFSQQCIGQDIQFTNQSINNSATPVYHWDFGVQGIDTDTSNVFSPFYSYPDTGTYVLTLLVNPGKACTDTLKKTIYAYPPLKIKYDRPERQCFTNNSFNFSAQGVYQPQSSFFWDFGNYASPANSTLKNQNGVSYSQSGLYFVKLKAQQFACRDSFVDSVRVLKKPRAKINNLQNGLCNPATVGFSNGSTSDLPLSYLWKFSDGKTSTDFEPTQVFTPAGAYTAILYIETQGLCKDTGISNVVTVIVNPRPVSKFNLTPTETSIFDPVVAVKSLASADVLSMTFNFGDGAVSQLLNDKHTYTYYADYTVTQKVVNGFGCVDSTSQIVRVLPEFRYWIPNCFSPDENGLNDFFMPVTIGVSNYEFMIFNRWGQNIFKSTTPEEGWNGKYEELECPQGIYIWKLSFKNIVSDKTEVHLGNVTLLRNP